MLINVGGINLRTMLNVAKISVGNILMVFLENRMWVVVLFCATFVLQLQFDVLVGDLHEDLRDDPGFLDLH
jgi:hypothetical protein